MGKSKKRQPMKQEKREKSQEPKKVRCGGKKLSHQALEHWFIISQGRCCLVAKSCLTLCNPLDCSLLGCFVHGISQARTLEWVATSFSRRSSGIRNQSWVSCIGR